MDATAKVADHLDVAADAIIGTWRAAVVRNGDVPRAAALTHEEFADHIPELIDRMADRLRGRPADVGAEGKKHGAMRCRQGYDLADLVVELAQFRTVLMQATFAYARARALDLPALEGAQGAIDAVLNEAVAESVGQFREDCSSQAEELLRRAEAGRREAEQARAAAEAERLKLRAILDNLPVGVWIVDEQGRVTERNLQAERMEAPGAAGHSRLIYPGSGPHLRRADGVALAPDESPAARALRGESVAQEQIAWRRGGEERIFLVSAAPRLDAAGRRVGAVVVAKDITARRKAEEAQHEQGLLLRLAHVLIRDPDGRIVAWDEGMARLYGWTRDEALGRISHDLLRTEFPGPRAPIDAALLRDGHWEGELTHARKDGSRIVVASHWALHRDELGRPLRVLEVNNDISWRKRLELELAASEARFRAIAEHSPALIWRCDAEGRWDYVNRTWLDFTGEPADRPADASAREDWVHPDDLDRRRAAIRAALAGRRPFEVAYRLRRKDGQYRWISDHGAPTEDAAGRFLGLIGSAIDIHDRIELEDALARQKAVAEEASRHKSRLLSALSHDARTPLNAVVLSAQLLEMNVGDQANPEVQECLRTIRHSVQNVLELLGDLLNLTRIDAGAVAAEPTRFEIEPALVECLSSVEPQARQKGLAVRFEPDGLVGLVVETDRAKLKQILSNLLSNALRYTERGHIRLYGAREDGRLQVAVEDTGMGIAPADQEKIFDEFARLEHPHRPTGEGTGLGLAICRRLAGLLGGRMTVRSARGRGSTFALELPASIVAANGSSDSIPTAAAAPASGTILVAEDHPASRQALARLLRHLGYRVVEAGNGREAVALARRERPAAVLMDLNMPVMDGIDAIAALRADPSSAALPIFALTGDVSPVNRDRAAAAGITGYIEKPVTFEALVQALAAVRSAH